MNDVWFDISDLNIGIEVADADIIPKEGFLDFGVALDVNINDAINPFLLDYMLSLCIEYNCEAYVDPFQVDIAAQIMLDVADLDGDGVNELNASFENFSYNYDLTSDDINVNNCALSTFEDVLFFGVSMFDLVLGIVEPTIEGLVVELVPTLEETIEDAFNQLSIQESIEFEGSVLDVALNPDDITIKPEGLRVQMNGSATTGEGADCISAFDPNGSLATPTTLRNIGYKPWRQWGCLGDDR